MSDEWVKHDPDQNHPTHCGVCSVRLPCDWNLAVAEIVRLRARIEELETGIRVGVGAGLALLVSDVEES